MSESHPTHKWRIDGVGDASCSCCHFLLLNMFNEVREEAKQPCRGWFRSVKYPLVAPAKCETPTASSPDASTPAQRHRE
jgi:hypothetical protein